MKYFHIGTSKIFLDGEELGYTLSGKNTYFKVTSINETLKNDNDIAPVGVINKGREINSTASIMFTEENYRKFKDGEIQNGNISFISCDGLFEVNIPNATIHSSHEKNFKNNDTQSIELYINAIQTESGRDFEYIEHESYVEEIEDYLQLGLEYSGILNEQFYLTENSVYLADDGIKYINTGGNRDWSEGNGTPDADFEACTFKNILENWFQRKGGIVNGPITADSFNTDSNTDIRYVNRHSGSSTSNRYIRRNVTDSNNIIRSSERTYISNSDVESYMVDIRDENETVTNNFELTRTGIYEDGEKLAKLSEIPYSYFDYYKENDLTITETETEVFNVNIPNDLNTGVYKMGLSVTYQFPDTNDFISFDVYVDDVLTRTHYIIPADAGNIETFSVFEVLEYTSGTSINITFKAKLSTGGNPATIYTAVLDYEYKGGIK